MRALFTLFLFIPIISFSQNYWLQQGSDIDGVAAGDQSGYSVSINYVGDRIIIGSPANDDNGLNSGHVRVFEWDGINFTQVGSDIVGDSVGDGSGWSVSMNASGNKIVIGAPWNDNNGLNSGQVRVFEWDGNNWSQQGQDIDGEAAGDESGYSVIMNNIGDRIAVGAPENDGNNSNSGQVRVFEWDGNNWIQLGQDIDGENGGNYFGSSVAMNVNGSRIAVGAPNNGNSLTSAPFSGHVRAYEWNGTNWIQLGQDIYGEAANDHSGRAVSMNGFGNRLVIGASNNDGNGLESGHVRVFEWNAINWIQLGQDIDGEAANDRFGLAVAFNEIGDRIVVGAPENDGNNSNSGQVRVFEWDGNNWSQQGQEIDGEAADDESGFSVGLNSAGDRVVISSYKNSLNTGHTRTYKECLRDFTVDYHISCDSYTWIDGNIYTNNNSTATDTLINTTGCDSVVTLNLTINNSSTGTDTQTACDTYTWIDGNTYTSSTNTPTYTLTNSVGCDSVVTLNLTINTVDNGITNNSPTLIANASTGTYQWLDCDNNNAVIPGETNQSFIATFNGNYAVEATQNGCIDTSACEQVNNVGINEFNSNITLHPNPTNDQITIDIKGYNGPVSVEVYDLNGKLLETTRTTTVSLKKYSKGIYIFKVSYGEITEEVRVVRD